MERGALDAALRGNADGRVALMDRGPTALAVDERGLWTMARSGCTLNGRRGVRVPGKVPCGGGAQPR